MKKGNLFIILLAITQLISCQTKKKTGFVIQDSKLYYNSKEIALGMPIEKFTDAMGPYDRIDIDSSGGFTNRTWHWKKEKYSAYFDSEEKKYIIFLNNEDLIRFQTMEELTSKYGKYDSIEETKSPLRIDKLFIWDELGVSLSAYPETNIVGNIFIQTLHLNKSRELDLGLVKNFEEERGLPLSKESQDKRKNDKWFFNRRPKKEYIGNFTFNGNTINLKDVGYTGWKKAIEELGISGSDYDPPGDSPQWSRWIMVHSDMYLTFNRFNNENEYQGLSPEKVGKFDCVRDIVIWWSRTNDVQ